MNPVEQLRALKALRERGIRNRIAALVAERNGLEQQDAGVRAEAVQLRETWRAAAQDAGDFNPRELLRHLAKLADFHRRNGELAAELVRLREERAGCERRCANEQQALRENLRGQEKFSYLAEHIAEASRGVRR